MKFDTPYDIRRGPLLARNVVATSQPLAAQAGLSMLYKGGNAIDAALAAAIVLTVVEPSGNGLGSDAFAILWDGEALHGLNASGRSPAALTTSEVAERGWGSVTVPGAISGWVALSDRFGALPFETLFGPAIDYAENGFPVSPIIARLWEIAGGTLGQQPGFAECFLPDGQAPKAGEIFKNPAQAASLKLIAQTKGAAFYTGELAEQIVADAARHGSDLAMSDLAEHTVDWCGTLRQEYAGVVLHEILPNGQGIAALAALGILGHFDLASLTPDSPQALHLQIEAIKLGLADAETFVADPAHMDVTPNEMLNPAYLARRAAEIDPKKAKVAVEGAPKHGGTVYITAADASGKMVSLIQSNYMGFGSGVVVPNTGISLQNRGAGFVSTPGHANQIGPGKQDGAPLMSFGVMGGPMQAQGHVQMVTRMMVHGQSPQAASDAPRWRFVEGFEVAVESIMPDGTVKALEAMGHKITREAPDNAFGFGGAQLIARQGDGYIAGSDHRKDGCAVGF